MTALHNNANSKNDLDNSFSSANVRLLPSTSHGDEPLESERKTSRPTDNQRQVLLLPTTPLILDRTQPFRNKLGRLVRRHFIDDHLPHLLHQQMPSHTKKILVRTKFMLSPINRQLIPILIAVSCRSPVNTQILIPAICNVCIASGTPSCSLSSIAVAPSKNMSFSISSAAWSSASPRPLTVAAAWV